MLPILGSRNIAYHRRVDILASRCLAGTDTHIDMLHIAATSALDSHSEMIVQEALDKIMFGTEQTCVVIAHRLSVSLY